MQVIFIKDLKKQAKKGEIKEVKDGYAQNYLIKNGYAVKLTESSLASYEKEKTLERNTIMQKEEEATKLKQDLEKVVLLFKVKTGEQDKVFGTVSSKQICEELKKKGIEIDKKKINITSPLDALGTYNVKVNLHKKVEGEIKVTLKK